MVLHIRFNERRNPLGCAVRLHMHMPFKEWKRGSLACAGEPHFRSTGGNLNYATGNTATKIKVLFSMVYEISEVYCWKLPRVSCF